jgi:hypothetical protein
MSTQQQSAPRQKLAATPHIWRPPNLIKPRDFLYGDCVIRGYVSGIIGVGGGGKTSELQVEIAAMVTGRPLLGIQPKHPYRVWYCNLEDPLDEIERRFAAIFKHYKITEQDLGNRLFIDSGRKKNFVVARQGRNGIEFDEDIIGDIEQTIRENEIDYVAADPYVNSARFAENDNNMMAHIIEHVWGGISDRQNCATSLAHHVRKGGPGHNGGYTVEDARGASALVSSCRNVRVLNGMSATEAEKAGVERHRSYFRIDAGKMNMTIAPEDSEWRKFVSVDLENATPDCPSDRVGVVTLWQWPDPAEQFTVADLIAAQKAVSKGGPWRADVRAKEWVGNPIAQALHLDIDSKADKEKIKGALKTWIKRGSFKEVSGQDDKRNKRTFIEVDHEAHEGAVTWSSREAKLKSEQERENKLKSLRQQTAAFRPVVVGNAPEGIECVHCQSVGDRPVLKIRDGRVPDGQPGGGPQCLHWQCAPKWFMGERFPTAIPPTQGRVREWVDWYRDETHRRYNENRLDASELDRDLRDTLRKEVPPELLDTVFKQVMDLALAV